MSVFINKGDPPMSFRQAVKRGLRHFEAEKSYWLREQGLVESDPTYLAWAQGWIQDNVENTANNVFNYHLDRYRKALDRLDKYRLVDGCPAVYEDLPTGELDPETGEPILESTMVRSQVEPVPAEIETETFDPETGEVVGTTMIPNPLVVADQAERDNAHTLVNNTPQEVKDWVTLYG